MLSGAVLQVDVVPSMDLLAPIIVLLVLLVVVVGSLWTKFTLVHEATADSDRTPPSELRNCPACGARIPQRDQECSHCGESFATDS